MNNSENSIKVVQDYFKAFQNGDIDNVLNLFHDNCLIVSVKDQEREKEQLHGTYRTKEEATQFIANIINLFNTKEFVVERVVGNENVVFANGKFTHEVKATGKLFVSDWTQLSIIEDNKIKEYRFYEDSAAFVIASEA
ncbi:nuclear transport factor 2 family protein [Flavivirga spongiicola]|uniref:Nuclear transport factor 2 family protein n=1 Tax=Flavivirga spongiicola TaxID=421621 RepID=A0ABU7Y135_9FLAO|nr:nuclear transport factor 2 family protein [Flavivirga sp. MEBiC05379]MDO5980971.1 nuclear transport factor 2 family protein [Flavivirga sp. MEBiC05379]